MNAPDLSTQDRFTYLKQQLDLPPQANSRLRNVALKWAALSACLSACLLGWFIPGLWFSPWFLWVDILWIGSFFFVALLLQLRRLDKQQRIPLVNELTRLDDLRAVGLLLTLPETVGSYAGESRDHRCPPEIRQALIRLLPHLHPADAIDLTVHAARGHLMMHILRQTPQMDAQTSLHNLLNDENEDLVVAVLTALVQVGAPAALPFVEPLTRGHRSPRIQAAAQHCYAVLAEPLARMQMPATLLRGASAPADTLLRPSLPGAEPASEELLRAHPPQPLS